MFAFKGLHNNILKPFEEGKSKQDFLDLNQDSSSRKRSSSLTEQVIYILNTSNIFLNHFAVIFLLLWIISTYRKITYEDILPEFFFKYVF